MVTAGVAPVVFGAAREFYAALALAVLLVSMAGVCRACQAAHAKGCIVSCQAVNRHRGGADADIAPFILFLLPAVGSAVQMGLRACGNARKHCTAHYGSGDQAGKCSLRFHHETPFSNPAKLGCSSSLSFLYGLHRGT